jgi:hypothetical protein
VVLSAGSADPGGRWGKVDVGSDGFNQSRVIGSVYIAAGR